MTSTNSTRGYDPMTKFQNKKKISQLEEVDPEDVFRVIGVDPKFDEHLRIFDESGDDAGLYLIHYLTLVPEVSHVRGIIVEAPPAGGPVRIVAGTFPYTVECSPVEFADNAGSVGVRYATIAYEGTILRLFYSKEVKTWYVATHKKINGFRSRWAGATFGESWLEMFGTKSPAVFFPEVAGKCYAFLLSDPSNRMVCQIPQKTLYHVGTFTGLVAAAPSRDDYISAHPNIVINAPIEAKTLPELIDVATKLPWSVATGVLVAMEGGLFVKLVPNGYTTQKEIRGNEPNMRMRYLQLMLENKHDDLRNLFPEKEKFFDEVDCQFNSLVPYLQELYTYRYEEGQYLRLEREEHYVLGKVFDEVSNGSVLPVTTLIENALTRSNARQLNAMIKHSNRLEVDS